MSTTPRRRVVMVGAVPMSALVAEAANPRAVIVAVHGGATSSTYFDCPGHPRLSLLRLAASLGYTAIALDRPGYGASALYQDEMNHSARRVELAWNAVDEIVGDGARGAGSFLVAHSAGCELALGMAVDGTRADVLGLELANTGLRYHPEAKDLLAAATTTSRPAGLRDLLWHPTDLYPPDVLTGALSAPGAPYESDGTRGQEFPALAGRVTVPVEFSVAHHETIWDTDASALADVVALFTSSPRVTLNEVRDSGHNLSVGLAAESYHRGVLSFVEECVTARGCTGPVPEAT